MNSLLNKSGCNYGDKCLTCVTLGFLLSNLNPASKTDTFNIIHVQRAIYTELPITRSFIDRSIFSWQRILTGLLLNFPVGGQMRKVAEGQDFVLERFY